MRVAYLHSINCRDDTSTGWNILWNLFLILFVQVLKLSFVSLIDHITTADDCDHSPSMTKVKGRYQESDEEEHTLLFIASIVYFTNVS